MIVRVVTIRVMTERKTMERVIGATEARVHFGELMRTIVEQNQVVVVERDGLPQVVVLSVETYRKLQANEQGPAWQIALARASAIGERIAARRGTPLPPVDHTLQEAREARDAQLDAAMGLR